MAERRRVRLPPPCAQPPVDEGPGRLLVEVDRLGRLGCGAGDELERGRLRDRRRLDTGKLLLQREQMALRLGRERLPNRPFLRLGLGALLRAATCLLGLRRGTRGTVDRRKRQHLLRAQPLQLVPQRGGRIRRRPRRFERARPEITFPKGAMEPDGELPRDLEPGQCRRVVAAVLVDRLVASAPEAMEQVDDVARVGRVALEAAEQVGLGFLHAYEHAGAGRKLLSEQLAELAQLHQAGDRIFGEVALRLRGHGHQRTVIAGEEAEVRAGGPTWTGHGRPGLDKPAFPRSLHAPRIDDLDPAAVEIRHVTRGEGGAP